MPHKNLHLCSFADSLSREDNLLGVRRTILLIARGPFWSPKKNSDRLSPQEEGMAAQEKQDNHLPQQSEEGGEDCSCGIPSQDPRQSHRDNKEITTPSILDTAGG